MIINDALNDDEEQTGGTPSAAQPSEPVDESGADAAAENAEGPEPTDDDNDGDGGMVKSEQPTPQEQSAYERVVLAGLKFLHDPASRDAFVQMLKQRAEDPAEALADTAVMLIQQIDKQSRGTLPEAVILPAASELLVEIATIAKGTRAFPVDKPTLAHAMQIMILALAQKYGVDQNELQDFMKSVDTGKAKSAIAPQGADAPAAEDAQPQDAQAAEDPNAEQPAAPVDEETEE